jgi:hypothetical protein
VAYVSGMSIVELKAEVDRLSPKDREKLRLYLKPKIKPLDAETRRRLAAKIDDKNPANWLTLEELKKRLGD